ncbi:MAG: hypothetical protein HY331_07515 [Chloroflexi bacterium]|nr:hypothetical protein [Chloroflexota bacterium]
MGRRYEEEIREVLRRMDDFLPEEPRRRQFGRQVRLWRNFLRVRLNQVRWLPPPGQLMLLTYAFALVVWAFGSWFGPLQLYLRLALGALFFIAYLLGLIGASRPPGRPYWRGRPIDTDPRPWDDWPARRRR